MGLLIQSQSYRFDNAFDILNHVMVRKVQDAVTCSPQTSVPPDISVRLNIVRVAIEFDDEATLAAEKVCVEILRDLHLPTELHPKL